MYTYKSFFINDIMIFEKYQTIIYLCQTVTRMFFHAQNFLVHFFLFRHKQSFMKKQYEKKINENIKQTNRNRHL